MYPKFPKVKGVRFAHIPDFPGYCVGTDGSVWSCRGRYRFRAVWRELKLGGDTCGGYRHVSLWIGNRPTTFKVHKLVLQVFVGQCPPNHECAHENGVRVDNRLTNLSWKTKKANQADKLRHGTVLIGEKHPMAKLSENDVRRIKMRLRRGETVASISKSYKTVLSTTIGFIKSGRSWRHIK